MPAPTPITDTWTRRTDPLRQRTILTSPDGRDCIIIKFLNREQHEKYVRQHEYLMGEQSKRDERQAWDQGSTGAGVGADLCRRESMSLLYARSRAPFVQELIDGGKRLVVETYLGGGLAERLKRERKWNQDADLVVLSALRYFGIHIEKQDAKRFEADEKRWHEGWPAYVEECKALGKDPLRSIRSR